MNALLSLMPLALLALIVGGIVVMGRRRAAARALQGAAPLTGIGGWLLLLVLGLTVLTPLLGAGRLNAEIMAAEAQNPSLSALAQWSTFKAGAWAVYALAAVLSVHAGVSLLRRRQHAVVTQAKIVLWLVGPCAALITGVVLPYFVFGGSPAGPEAWGATLAAAVPAAVWHAYLSRSVRVRNTYPPPSGA